MDQGTAGATITQGQVVFKDAAAASAYKLADCNATSPAGIDYPTGIALNSASSGQPLSVANGDTSFTPGFTSTAGIVVALSATPGALCPVADVESVGGVRTSVCGIMLTTTTMYLKFTTGGIQ